MRLRLAVTGLALLLAASAGYAQKDKKKSGAKQPGKDAPLVRLPEKDQIDLSISEMLAAWQIGDAALLHRYYADDVIVTRGDWNAPIVGWTNYLQAYQEQRARTQAALLNRTNTYIQVSGNVGWATYQWDFRGTVDNAPSSAQGHTTLIFEKRGDRWLIVHNHTSLAAPPASSAPLPEKKP